MLDILKRWCEFCDFDPDNPHKKTRFTFTFGNEVDVSYEVSKRNERLIKFMQIWDKEGYISTIYAKKIFQIFSEHTDLNLKELLSGNVNIDKYKDIWNMFHSTDYVSVTNIFNNVIHNFIDKLSPVEKIGQKEEHSEDVLLDALEAVVLDSNKLNIETYCKDSTPIKIDNICPNIIVCNTVSECLLKLANSPDAVYICYIANYRRIDGWFGFFIKSGNNLLSINERLWEAYKGQHQHCRNGRYAEDKCYNLFPYELVEFSGSDYKGYTTAAKIASESTPIIQTKCALNIAIMLYVIYQKFNTKENNFDEVFVDALLPANQKELLETDSIKALIVKDENTVALLSAQHAVDKISFTDDEIISNKIGEDVSYNAVKESESFSKGLKNYYKTYGSFHGHNQDLVEMFGKGFVQSPLMKVDMKNMLTSDNSESISAELVGSLESMKLWKYYEARKQLAEYIKQNAMRAFNEFGGKEGVRNWFYSMCDKYKHNLLKLCARYIAEDLKFGDPYGLPVGKDFNVVRQYSEDYDYRKYSCRYVFSSSKNNNYFRIHFLTAAAFNEIFRGEKIPDLLAVYRCLRPMDGNSILTATDAVADIIMPYESTHRSMLCGDNYVNFEVDLCVSQRDLSKEVTICKQSLV